MKKKKLRVKNEKDDEEKKEVKFIYLRVKIHLKTFMRVMMMISSHLKRTMRIRDMRDMRILILRSMHINLPPKKKKKNSPHFLSTINFK
jgi:hypothetical protein